MWKNLRVCGLIQEGKDCNSVKYSGKSKIKFKTMAYNIDNDVKCDGFN